MLAIQGFVESSRALRAFLEELEGQNETLKKTEDLVKESRSNLAGIRALLNDHQENLRGIVAAVEKLPVPNVEDTIVEELVNKLSQEKLTLDGEEIGNSVEEGVRVLCEIFEIVGEARQEQESECSIEPEYCVTGYTMEQLGDLKLGDSSLLTRIHQIFFDHGYIKSLHFSEHERGDQSILDRVTYRL